MHMHNVCVLCVNKTSWFMIMYRSRAKRRVMHGVLETGDLGMIKKTKKSSARALCARSTTALPLSARLSVSNSGSLWGVSRGLKISLRAALLMQAHMSQLTR